MLALEPLALAEMPHHGAALNLAQAYMAKGWKEEALHVLEVLASRSPGHPRVQFMLALVLEVLGDTSKAEEAYQREIEARPRGRVSDMRQLPVVTEPGLPVVCEAMNTFSV